MLSGRMVGTRCVGTGVWGLSVGTRVCGNGVWDTMCGGTMVCVGH